MRFTVEGADLKTGDDRTVIISATNAADAEGQARKMGLVVSRIWANDSEQVVPPIPTIQLAAKDMSLKAAAVQMNAPDYSTLKTFASLFFVFAVLAYVIAGIVAVVAIISLFATVATRGQSLAGLMSAPLIFYSVGWIVVGIFNQGTSAILLAFRDLVRNSFR
jgi:hypothetical protein